MNKDQFTQSLRETVPEMPEIFDQAMRAQLDQIVREAHDAPPPRHVPVKRRWAAILVAALLLLTAAALAASLLKLDLFEATIGAPVENGKTIMQYDLAQARFGDFDISIRQACYDGMSLYVVYSVTDRTATEPLGAWDEDFQQRTLTDKDYDRLNAGGIPLATGWFDCLWLDGADTDIPGGTTGTTIASGEPGEVLCYIIYPLSNEEVYLDGTQVEVTLPIGARQDYATLVHDPETRAIIKPTQGVVSFRLDCSSRAGIETYSSEEYVDLGGFTARVKSAVFTPVQLYLTIDKVVKPEALAAYIEANGPGFIDEDGTMLYPYDGMELSDEWAYAVQLVDESGHRIFTDAEMGWFGNQGHGAAVDWFTFPYKTDLPEHVYLAPVDGDTADMTQALQVR